MTTDDKMLTMCAKAMFECEWGEGSWDKATEAERSYWKIAFQAGLKEYLDGGWKYQPQPS